MKINFACMQLFLLLSCCDFEAISRGVMVVGECVDGSGRVCGWGWGSVNRSGAVCGWECVCEAVSGRVCVW